MCRRELTVRQFLQIHYRKNVFRSGDFEELLRKCPRGQWAAGEKPQEVATI
jgi:hypothetical protein